MKLALAQITLGALLIVAACFNFVNGLPTMFRIADNTMVNVMWGSAITTRYFALAMAFFIIGLGTIVLGIVQMYRERRQAVRA